jgi:glycopeptide antibiotics resistance protein
VTGGAGLRTPPSTGEEPPALHSSPVGGRGLVVALFVAYLVLLTWVVLWKLQMPYVGEGALRHIKLVPFVPTTEDGASDPLEVIANVMLFVPFGLYLGLLAPWWPWWKLGGVVAGSSLALEVTQWVLSVGSCDITDLVVNTAGGLAGLGLLVLARLRLQDRTGTVMTRVCSIGTAILLLAAGIFIASPVHYAPMRDVDVRLGSTP